MAKQIINRGSTAGDGTGEVLYNAFGKVNDNFTELYNGFKELSVISANYTLTNNDGVIETDTSGITITLPTATTNAGKIFLIDNSSSGSVTVETTGGEFISGITGENTSITLLQNEVLQIQSNGVKYRLR